MQRGERQIAHDRLVMVQLDFIRRTILVMAVVAGISVVSLAAGQGHPSTSMAQRPVETDRADDPSGIDVTRKAQVSQQFWTDQKMGRGDAPSFAVTKPLQKDAVSRPVTPGEATPHDYMGFIGDASINLTMTIYQGKVSGDFYFLRAPGTLYTFTGSNALEGLLTLAIASGGVPFAEARLTKDPRATSVLWDGQLKTADQQSRRLFLNRPLQPAAATGWPATVEAFERLSGYERYEGSLTDARGVKTSAVFKLRFDGVKCGGFYYQIRPDGRKNFVFRLDGQNPEGLLTLREFDDEGMSAELHLRKNIVGNVVTWRGEMTNHRRDQQVKKVEFQRNLRP